MKIIVCNIGSSSFKFQLLEMPSERQIARGYTERVGSSEAVITYWFGPQQALQEKMPVPSHREAVRHALDFLVSKKVLASLNDIDGVGFKTVQAGEKSGSLLLTDDVLQAMEDYRDLAPAHNPPYLTAIYMFREILPKVPLVGVFEPGFHAGMPEYARVYGAPYEWYEKYNVRRYGYHGSSHRFVAWETVKLLGLPENAHRIITCHLGGSSSLCAFKDGRSIDTSMGFTPQSGLLQGTRIGDMDPFVLPYIMKRKGITLEQALEECSKKGGLAGLSGISADMRDVKQAVARGDARAKLARDKFIYDIKRYIGEYIVLLEGLDGVTFTGGIGQRDTELRLEVLKGLGFLGLKVDEKRNAASETVITTSDSAIKALVIETNEEIEVARETLKVIS
ncbi:MAG: acetate/propionate family kinase [Bacteroidota bacterium]|jgi:acetate kinase